MSVEKEKYRRLCETEESLPIFSRDWWLDVTCGPNKWEVLLIERHGRIEGSLPLYIPTTGIISMPAYTQTMGPWLAPGSADTKYTSELGRRQALCTQLTERLRDYTYFLQNFSYKISDWLPFYWAGYRQTTRYTYLLPDITQPDKLWENMSANIRRNISRARDKHHILIRKGIPVEEFFRVQAKTFERQRLRDPGDPSVLRRLIETCRSRQQGDLWGAYDEQGNLHAAVFIAWQPGSAYYLAGGGDPAYRSSGAHSYLLWECINQMASYTRRFDFEGSMLPGVERFFREFGAIQTPFFTIFRGKLSLLDRARIKVSKWI